MNKIKPLNYVLQCSIGSIISILGVIMWILLITPATIFLGAALYFAGIVVIIFAVPKELKWKDPNVQ